MNKTVVRLCKSIVGSTFASFVCFFLFNIIYRAIFEKVENINSYLYVINMLTYSICFYFIHVWKLDVPFYSAEKFDFTKEVFAYFKLEGKYLLLVYGVLAIFCEINYLVIPDETKGKLIATLCSMCFPYFGSIKIPGVRSIISVLLATVISFMLAVYHSYKSNKIKE